MPDRRAREQQNRPGRGDQQQDTHQTQQGHGGNLDPIPPLAATAEHRPFLIGATGSGQRFYRILFDRASALSGAMLLNGRAAAAAAVPSAARA